MDHDNAKTLIWLDDSLRWANGEGRPKLVSLLTRVREDVSFDLETTNAAKSPLRRHPDALLSAVDKNAGNGRG
ncbi:hypothetical protein BH20ACT12_BH20ACT12_01220 [soil metagenome]|nr:hypothetical protein [Rubrobacteraceae bacterium]MDQ3436787.1 hypothetical protein [Actinomycetota bacterium]